MFYLQLPDSVLFVGNWQSLSAKNVTGNAALDSRVLLSVCSVWKR